jgi:FkbM family methyltransferase
VIRVLKTFWQASQELPEPRLGGGFLGMIRRFARWQVAGRIWPDDLVFEFVSGTRLAARRGQYAATSAYYLGLDDWQCCGFILHYLRPDDLFVDVGANVGTYSVLAGAVAGATVIGFEPSSDSFRRALHNTGLNLASDRVILKRIALGSKPGAASIATDKDTVNQIDRGAPGSGEQIEIDTLDRAIEGHSPSLLKIDTVGYERSVLLGAGQTLASPLLDAIIVGNPRRALADFDVKPEETLGILSAAGFRPTVYSLADRSLSPVDIPDINRKILLVRHDRLEAVRMRLKNAPRFRVLGGSF